MELMRPDISEGIGTTGNRQANIEVRQAAIESGFAVAQQDARSTTPSGTELALAAGTYDTLATRLAAEELKTGDYLASVDTRKSNQSNALAKALNDMGARVQQDILAKDTFSSGTATPILTERGPLWNILSGSFRIESGKVFSNTAGTWSKMVVETNNNNCEVSAVVRSFEGAPRIIFRVKDSLNYWFFGIQNELGLTNFLLARVVNGVVNGHASYNNWATSASLGSRLRVVMNGTSVKCYINNYKLFDITAPSDFLTETKHGLSMYDTKGEMTSFLVKSKEVIDYTDNIIASVDNMLVVHDGSNLLLSVDGGRSYQKGLSVQNIAIIKYVHLFADGKIMFADHTKVYYSHDWKTYSESAVYNEDNTPYVPNQYDNFSSYKNGTVKKTINGLELAVWGNYSTDSAVEYTNKIKVWYTEDKGVTVKCSYTFNTSTTAKCRHIHAVDFNPVDNSFWLQTGDEPLGADAMSHWIKGTYDVGTDTWTWVVFASGLDFKSTNMIFHTDGYVYWSWDKTPGGIVKAPYATLGDKSTHILLFSTNKDCNFIIVGKNGDIAGFQTAWGGTEQPRVFYYAPDGINFKRIVGTMPYAFDQVNDAQYQAYWGINANGKVLAGVQSLATQNIRDWDRKPSVFIDDILKDNGFPNAFK